MFYRKVMAAMLLPFFMANNNGLTVKVQLHKAFIFYQL
jgi:hypothetical protein